MVDPKPHSITVALVAAPVNPVTKVRGVPAPGSGQSLAAYVEYMTPSESFNQFGVSLESPVRIFVEVSDVEAFAPNAQIEFGGVSFSQRGRAEVHNDGLDTDHAVIYAHVPQYPL